MLEVDFDAYLKEAMVNLQDNLRKDFRQDKIGYLNLRNTDNQVSFSLRGEDQYDEAMRILEKNKDLNISLEGDKIILGFTQGYMEITKARLIEQSIEIIRRRALMKHEPKGL